MAVKTHYYLWYIMLSLCCGIRAAAMTLRTVLLSLQALLAAAEPDDPQDAVVATQYKDAPEIFNKTARHWANIYANGMSFMSLIFTARRYASAVYAMVVCLSVCLSVCPSQVGVLLKWLNICLLYTSDAADE